MRRTIVAALAATIVVGIPLPALGTGDVVFRPGAPGIGDPYFPLEGNGGYDVAAYDLAVQYTPATDVLRGVATISAHATANLSSFNLDFDGLTVRSITVGRTAATWTRDGGELTVTPAAGLRTGSAFTTVVHYDGVPKTLGSRLIGVSGFIHTDDGALVVGEPDVAATWFPVNDHPSDKATYTVRVTVPAGLQVVSNGVPTGHNTAAGWTTWSWAEPEPMASYLATLAIGRFDLTSYGRNGIRFVDAIDVDLSGTREGTIARAAFAREPEILDFLATDFGPYPFASAGGTVDGLRTLGFALENQTRPTYARSFFTDQVGADSVVVHELSHQWFGDSVAVDAWQHIWLNEGFATYAEWLWSEHEGLGTVEAIFDSQYARRAGDPFWKIVIGDPGPQNLFSRSVYERGAMTLQALRTRIGDTDFFTLLRSWARVRADGNGTTLEFSTLAERISGQQLDSFFQAWLFTGEKPAL